MKITQLQGVQFKVESQEDGTVMLSFLLGMQVAPGQMALSEIVAVPFDAESWQNFKRQVAADGAISPITVAKMVPGNNGV